MTSRSSSRAEAASSFGELRQIDRLDHRAKISSSCGSSGRISAEPLPAAGATQGARLGRSARHRGRRRGGRRRRRGGPSGRCPLSDCRAFAEHPLPRPGLTSGPLLPRTGRAGVRLPCRRGGSKSFRAAAKAAISWPPWRPRVPSKPWPCRSWRRSPSISAALPRASGHCCWPCRKGRIEGDGGERHAIQRARRIPRRRFPAAWECRTLLTSRRGRGSFGRAVANVSIRFFAFRRLARSGSATTTTSSARHERSARPAGPDMRDIQHNGRTVERSASKSGSKVSAWKS